jgi:serine/threonine protein phosphatase PrpC
VGELVVTSFGGSFRGGRKTNEDALGQREPRDPEVQGRLGSLYVVADGMGGHRAGEVASRLAVETTLAAYYQTPAEGDGALRHAIDLANRRVVETAATCEDWAGMGCTIVACLVRDARATVAHVGDSRAYLIRNGDARLLTRDHLYVTEVLGLDDEAASKSRQRHVLSRALGVGEAMRADVVSVGLVSGDRIMLCTDGVSNVIEGDEIAPLIGRLTPNAAVRRLLALTRARRTPDNASALVISVAAASTAGRLL